MLEQVGLKLQAEKTGLMVITCHDFSRPEYKRAVDYFKGRGITAISESTFVVSAVSDELLRDVSRELAFLTDGESVVLFRGIDASAGAVILAPRREKSGLSVENRRGWKR